MIDDKWKVNDNHQQNGVHGGSEGFLRDSGSGRGCLGLAWTVEIHKHTFTQIQIYTNTHLLKYKYTQKKTNETLDKTLS